MRCAACGRTARTRCGRCRLEHYCDRECQAAHWKVHKATCKVPQATTSGSFRPSAGQSSSSSARPSGSSEESVPLCGNGFRKWLVSGSNWRKVTGADLLEEPRVGITNWSNNCYLSAVCQCLLHTPLLREHLRDAFCEAPEDEWLNELLGLCRLLDNARRRGSKYVDPPRRLSRLIAEANEEFAFGRQADAHEALMLLISRWLAGCVKAGDGSGADCSRLGYQEKEQLEATSMIGHVFGMLMGSKIACTTCSYESIVSRVEYCICLTVTLGMSDDELQKCRQESAQQLNRWCLRSPLQGPRPDSSTSPTSLSKLLDEYTKRELISEFKCEKCECQGGYRTAFLRRRPNVFVVYIDRRQDCNLFGKINRRVSFPAKLDLSRWISKSDATKLGGDTSGVRGSTVYSLYAMCVHHDLRGSTASGHYVAYARDRSSRWYQIDDETVRQVQWSDVEEQHAYLLFYMAEIPLELGEPVPSAEESGGKDVPRKKQEDKVPERKKKKNGEAADESPNREEAVDRSRINGAEDPSSKVGQENEEDIEEEENEIEPEGRENGQEAADEHYAGVQDEHQELEAEAVDSERSRQRWEGAAPGKGATDLG
mmetsp:Transcript_99829/g.177685  ORF Transcript_99829/g.177685 Transcript_99829/m.177685 type:complete len:597 (+) Transcript_99829:266-2056(+)